MYPIQLFRHTTFYKKHMQSHSFSHNPSQFVFKLVSNIFAPLSPWPIQLQKHKHVMPVVWELNWTDWRCENTSHTRWHCRSISISTVWRHLTLQRSVYRRQSAHSLRSAGRYQLYVPRTSTTMETIRAFSVNGPDAWNSLPADQHSPDISENLFRKKL